MKAHSVYNLKFRMVFSNDNLFCSLYFHSITSFRINKMLVGQNVQTGFSQMEFENAYKLFDATVIKPLQNNIRKVFEQIGIEIEFKPFKIDWSDGTIQ